MFSGFETDPNVCANFYRSWKAARDALSQSIQSYLNACDALTSVSINVLTQSVITCGSSVSDALSAIETELSGLVHEEERLRKARLSLLESRNRSKAFSAISTLPAEILSLIFLAAKPAPDAGGTSPPSRFPAAIASVCQLWRQTALALTSMWSYLYYVIHGPLQVSTSKCAELWSERARDAPRYVEMCQMDPRISLDEAIEALELNFEPQASHVECLYLECSRMFIQAVLCSLINKGTPGSTRVLQLHEEDEHDNSNHILAFHEILWLDAPSPDRTSEFLSMVQFLELENTYFPWDSTAYENLLELSLILLRDYVSENDFLPTQYEMRTILSSSPMLHTLSLKFASSLRERHSSVEPIRLDNLQYLTLRCYDSPGCLGLLPLIEPGRKGLNVNVTVHSNSSFVEEMRSFFHRSTITTLYIKPITANFWFKLLSKNLSHLESLTLDGCDFRDRDLSDFLHASPTSHSPVSPWPKLHTLGLANCQIEGDILQKLVSINSIRKIRLDGGSMIRLQSRLGVGANSKAISMQELEQRLSTIVPDTKYLKYVTFSLR